MPSRRKGWLIVPGTPGASGETTDTITHSATEEVVWVGEDSWKLFWQRLEEDLVRRTVDGHLGKVHHTIA
jgi:hypothetical protein